MKKEEEEGVDPVRRIKTRQALYMKFRACFRLSLDRDSNSLVNEPTQSRVVTLLTLVPLVPVNSSIICLGGALQA